MKEKATIFLSSRQFVYFSFLLFFLRSWYYEWAILGHVPYLKEFKSVLEELTYVDTPVVLRFDEIEILNSQPEWE